MGEWTPGPWEIYHDRFIHHKGGREDPRIGYVYCDFVDCPLEEANANARLIAQAPELVALVQRFVAACREQDIKLGSIIGDAEAALRAVEGQ